MVRVGIGARVRVGLVRGYRQGKFGVRIVIRVRVGL